MEPRSTDDARQLVKLQRGVLTAVVTVMNEIEQRYEDRFTDRCAEVEAEFQAKVEPIEAEVSSMQ
jgi:phage host-nuclease inhibitor protein Gam